MQKIYVGITNDEWFYNLRDISPKVVNFWTPGAKNFKALSKGEWFLFKLHAPQNYIVGGGKFDFFSIMSLSNAWKKYSIQNGVYALQDLTSKVRAYRKNTRGNLDENSIGCILLKDVVFLAERDWFPPPADWSRCIVRGKTYEMDSESGTYIFENFIKGQKRLLSEKTSSPL